MAVHQRHWYWRKEGQPWIANIRWVCNIQINKNFHIQHFAYRDVRDLQCHGTRGQVWDRVCSKLRLFPIAKFIFVFLQPIQCTNWAENLQLHLVIASPGFTIWAWAWHSSVQACCHKKYKYTRRVSSMSNSDLYCKLKDAEWRIKSVGLRVKNEVWGSGRRFHIFL